jgi:DNA polymerase-4
VKRSILHADLDAFYASVEVLDNPSLRGKPVIVGGLGPRGVVATASYEARAYGARSAMPTSEARRRCPAGTAFLSGRFDAYRKSSSVVMDLLAELSPAVEQVSIDEAYVDLAEGAHDLSVEGVTALGTELLDRLRERTGGLTASAGIASSKLMAKIGSELHKPAGLTVVAPGKELELLHPLPVTVIAGVGPATEERLRTFGVRTVADLAGLSLVDLVSILGQAHGAGLHQLARAVDDRPVVTVREAKSISAEETFDADITDDRVLRDEIESLARRVGQRLVSTGLFGRTITLKARHHDFSTVTRSSTLGQATADAALVAAVAGRLLAGLDTTNGLRLLGVGVSGLAAHAQDELQWEEVSAAEQVSEAAGPAPAGVTAHRDPVWRTGQDVMHERHGPGWVWGSGAGRVTVRFEGPTTPAGPVRTFAADDPALAPTSPPDWEATPVGRHT